MISRRVMTSSTPGRFYEVVEHKWSETRTACIYTSTSVTTCNDTCSSSSSLFMNKISIICNSLHAINPQLMTNENRSVIELWLWSTRLVSLTNRSIYQQHTPALRSMHGWKIIHIFIIWDVINYRCPNPIGSSVKSLLNLWHGLMITFHRKQRM